jgi:Xaa-Pro aminopeptidase
VPAGDLYQRAIDIAARKGVGDHFMGTGNHRIRFIGHGIGLEVDEFPFLAQGQTMPLAEGMIIALEPKLILPGVGVVGIENTHVVTADGLATLTHADEAIRSLPVR